MKRFITALAGAAIAVTALAGCAAPAEPVALGDDTVIIDVRSAQEHAEGHLDGAVLLDVSSGELDAAIPSLDPTLEYAVYCRSGNRSAQAAQKLRDAGFEKIIDLGSLQSASEATGIAVIL